MMLEASSHEQNSFLTLTYSPENLPAERVDKHGQIWAENSVDPSHVKKFIHNLRRQARKKGFGDVRYFACGEYGDDTGRPHYHLALFGFPPCCGRGPTYIGRKYVPCNCVNCDFLSKVWRKGHAVLLPLEPSSAAYIAGYVVKKLTKVDDFTDEILQGRFPEFSRQSRNKGLGYQAISEFAEKLKPYVKERDDVPPYLVHDGKKWPLGRYLSNVLMEKLGFPPLEEGEAIARYEKNLHDLFESKTPVSWSARAVAAGLPDVALKLLNAQPSLQLEKQYQRKKGSKL